MEEELFTAEEMQEIIDEAKNSIYSEPNMSHYGISKTSIIGVSPTNGLILANGNEWTGYRHIMERHNITSRKPYWDYNNKLDNPTKFRPTLVPADYLIVASKIFQPINLDSSKNKFPDRYEVYTGNFTHYDGVELRYRLLVYKSTKIIHTFYLCENKKPFNKQKILDLRQGWVKAYCDDMRNFQSFEIPYYDILNIEKYKVVVNILGKSEKWHIQVNDINGNPYLTTCIKEIEEFNRIHFMLKSSKLEYENPSWYEKIIKQIIDEKYIF